MFISVCRDDPACMLAVPLEEEGDSDAECCDDSSRNPSNMEDNGNDEQDEVSSSLDEDND